MKKKIIEAHELPHDEKIWLKKDWAGYRTVNYWKRDPDLDANIFKPKTWDNINWFNLVLGGKSGLLQSSIYIIIALVLYVGINQVITEYRDAAENPCDYCRLAEDFRLNPNFTDSLRLGGGFDISIPQNITGVNQTLSNQEGDLG